MRKDVRRIGETGAASMGWVAWSLGIIFLLLVLGVIASRHASSQEARAYESRQRIVGISCKRTVSVVGEYYRQPAVRAAMRRANEGLFLASLEMEPANDHDPFAIRVQVGIHHVGYLASDMARTYHSSVELAARFGELVTVRAFSKYDPYGSGGPNHVLLYLPVAKSLEAELHSYYAQRPGATA